MIDSIVCKCCTENGQFSTTMQNLDVTAHLDEEWIKGMKYGRLPSMP